jgi:glycosyltransferase involved in cell wall biosynthesis
VNKANTILFITPSSSRGGSEKYIWNIFLNIHKTKFEGGLFSLHRGTLFDDYKNPSNTFYSKWTESFLRLLLKGFIRKFFGINLIEHELLKAHKKLKADIWYLNTVVMPEIAELARRNNIKYIVHSHEMISVYDTIDKNLFFPMLFHAKAVIACSQAVAKPLEDAGLTNIVVEHELVDISEIKIKTSAQLKRKEFKIGPDKFVWLMSGQRNYRKGMDFILKLSRSVNSSIEIVWVGGHANSNLSQMMARTIQNLSLRNVHLIEEKGRDEYYDILNMADALLLTSREDPFPLVMTEAAFLGKPILGFNSGGIKEFVNIDSIGMVIENFNLNELINEMNFIAEGKIIFSKDAIIKRSLEFSLENRLLIWEEKVLKILIS